MERNGNTYRQETYISDPEFYPRKYLTPFVEKIRPAYYVLDETPEYGFAYAPKAAPGQKYCIFNRFPGDRPGENHIGNYRQYAGSLKELRPKDWGFHVEKIKAVTGRKPKARSQPER